MAVYATQTTLCRAALALHMLQGKDRLLGTWIETLRRVHAEDGISCYLRAVPNMVDWPSM